MSIGERSILWKTISSIILVFLAFLVIFGNLVLAAPFYINNNFIDYQHPTSAKWDTNNVKAGESPALKIEFESPDVSQERFYNFFNVPNTLRIDLSFINVSLLVLVIGLVYFIGQHFLIKDDNVEPVFVFWTCILPQIVLFVGFIISSWVYYHSPDLTTLGINDAQMAEKANSVVNAQAVLDVVIMLVVLFIVDFIVMFLSLIIVASCIDLAKKIKATILERLTLGNQVFLCCNNGILDLVSIDFELKWIPFPALFLKKRVIDRFSAGDTNTRRLRDWLGGLSTQIQEEHIQKLTQLNMIGESLLIGTDESVQLVKLESAVEWRPLPQTVVHKEIIRQISFDHFFRYLVADSKQVALDELKGMLVGSYQERFNNIGKSAVIALVKGVCEKTLQVLQSSISKITDDQNNLAAQNATNLLQQLTDGKLEAFKQEIVASIGEALQVRVSNNIKAQILAPLRSVLAEQLPLVNSNGSMDALPEGTRFFFSHGERQIVIVEQKPQTRSVYFRDSFVGGGGRYNLAFPYVIFQIVFIKGECEHLFFYYANKPMTSLDSEVFGANLPNINSEENTVCTGFHGCRASSLSGKVEEVIAHFWQSSFNNDLSHGYNLMAEHGGAFRNLSAWQKASQKDPLFVLRVNWRACDSRYNPSQIVSRYMNGTLASKVANFDHLISQILESEGVNIGALARQCCESIRVDQRYPRKAVSALKQQLMLLSQSVCSSFEETLSGLVKLPDEKSLLEAVSSATAQAVEAVIAQDFARCANQVLLRRRVSSKEVIDQILRQR